MRILLSSPQGAVYQTLFRTGNRVKQRAEVLAPVDQGRLRTSIKLEMDTENGVPIARVGTNVEYAIWVHEGTGIYGPRKTPIVPKNFRYLKWPVKNQSGQGRRRYKGGKTENFAYAKSVRGMKPRPFLTRALQQVTGQS